MLLTKQQILAANDLKSEVVKVNEWGGEVKVRTMTAAERDDFEADVFTNKTEDTKKNLKNLRAKLLARVIINEQGEKLFTEGDIPALGSKSSKVLDRLFTIAQKLNGLGVADVEELTKN